jgi:hypothetical protein
MNSDKKQRRSPMMKQEFEIEFEKLTEAFPVATPGKKARIYFEELRSYSAKNFEIVVRKWIRNFAKFPTIADLLQHLQQFDNTNESGLNECEECDGRGGVKIIDQTFRARCHHGKTMVPQWVTLVPATFEERRLTETRLLAEWRKIYCADWPRMNAPSWAPKKTKKQETEELPI